MSLPKHKKIDHIPVNVLHEGELVQIGLGWIAGGVLEMRIEEKEIVSRFERLAELGQVEGVTVGFQYRTGK